MSVILSVVIPIYNSAKIVRDTVEQLRDALIAANIDYEILLRDDGSKDGSWSVLEEIAKEYPQIQISSNGQNRGLGYTLRQLFQEAKGEVLLYVDCDLPFGTKPISEILQRMENVDIVVVSRYAGIQNQVTLLRKVLSRLYYFLCRGLFSISVRDIGSGMVAFRKAFLPALDLRADGFDFHIEFFTQAGSGEMSLVEIPAASTGRTQGSFRICEHGPRILRDTFRLWLKERRCR